ncbi:hypothetical protein [Zavarzinella formosa]|uniref:hypothetical protein n=1 Tax=Zavarzinella formosa TaxID=360055 RepID=UPI0002FBC7D1|nr:hypothetical protein [Zavarzinella formosa]
MKKTEEMLVMFGGHECRVRVERYASSGHTALILDNAWDGQQVAVATVNMPDIPLPPNQVFIKDYGEQEGMLKALEEAGFVKASGVRAATAIGPLPVCDLLVPPPEQEKALQLNDLLGGTGFADSRGDFARDLLNTKDQPEKPKSRGFEMER